MAVLRPRPEQGQETESASRSHTFRYLPSYPPVAAILAERRTVAAVLRDCGVSPADLDDAIQEVVIAAWLAIQRSRYRPDPQADAAHVFRAWLRGIAWRQAAHHTGRSWRRREIPHPDPRELGDDQGDVELHRLRLGDDAAEPTALDRLCAQEVGDRLREAVRSLSPEFQHVIRAVAGGQSVEEYAYNVGIGISTAYNRIRLARGHLRAWLDRAELGDQWAERTRPSTGRPSR